jgi:hypothetical protein
VVSVCRLAAAQQTGLNTPCVSAALSDYAHSILRSSSPPTQPRCTGTLCCRMQAVITATRVLMSVLACRPHPSNMLDPTLADPEPRSQGAPHTFSHHPLQVRPASCRAVPPSQPTPLCTAPALTNLRTWSHIVQGLKPQGRALAPTF